VPNPAERREYEAVLFAAVQKILRDHAVRLAVTQGQASWSQLETELRRVLRPVLAAIYARAARQMLVDRASPVPAAGFSGSAEAWAAETAATLAAELTQGSRERTVELLQRLRAGQLASDELQSAMLSVFGPGRSFDVAISEVTRAISAGEHAAAALVVLDENQSLEPPRDIWGDRFPTGPPAHPRCRCWMEWAIAVR